ncbi:hypothetical protein HYS28_03010, partial [Candidatus Uhrbacteria bacterium]|nr:hypothetical protein [Candidatus Uhrbacteria bacterium]
MFLLLASVALAAPAGMIDVTTVAPTVVVEMKYATPDNFMGYAFYSGTEAAVCWLTPETAAKVAAAEITLSAQGYHLVMYDCARPVAYQYAMWDSCVANHGASHCGGLVANPYDKPSSLRERQRAVDHSVHLDEADPLERRRDDALRHHGNRPPRRRLLRRHLIRVVALEGVVSRTRAEQEQAIRPAVPLVGCALVFQGLHKSRLVRSGACGDPTGSRPRLSPRRHSARAGHRLAMLAGARIWLRRSTPD